MLVRNWKHQLLLLCLARQARRVSMRRLSKQRGWRSTAHKGEGGPQTQCVNGGDPRTPERPKQDPDGWTARRYAVPGSSRILSRPLVLDEIRASVVFLRERAWAGARGRGHLGASVSRRRRGCHRVCKGRAGVRVCRRKGASVSVVLFLLLPVCLSRRSQQNMTGPIRRLSPSHFLFFFFRIFCASVVRHGVVLDVFKIPTYAQHLRKR